MLSKLKQPADLFLMCDNGRGEKSYQIWVNNKEDGFSLSQEGALPSGVQSISFADIGQFLCFSPSYIWSDATKQIVTELLIWYLRPARGSPRPLASEATVSSILHTTNSWSYVHHLQILVTRRVSELVDHIAIYVRPIPTSNLTWVIRQIIMCVWIFLLYDFRGWYILKVVHSVSPFFVVSCTTISARSWH